LLSVRNFTVGEGDCQARMFCVITRSREAATWQSLLRLSLDLDLLRHYNLCLF
jgi:hypothetical protein